MKLGPEVNVCPTCKGKGILNVAKGPKVQSRRTAVLELNKQGYSIREIAKIMRFKSHHSVQWILARWKGNQ